MSSWQGPQSSPRIYWMDLEIIWPGKALVKNGKLRGKRIVWNRQLQLQSNFRSLEENGWMGE